MVLLDESQIDVDYKAIRKFTQERNALFRKMFYATHYENSDLFSAYLIKFQTLKEIMKIKSAQQEAQSKIELEAYVKNLRVAMDYVMESVARNEPVNSHIQLIYLHRIIDPESHLRHPSSYRKSDVMFGPHEAIDFKKIYSLVENLFYKLEKISHPVVRAIYAHHELVRIHPFMDGNGRVARMVMNWILMYDMYPPIFIKTVKFRKQYIKDLDESFSQLEINPSKANEATNRFFRDEIKRIARNIHFLVVTLLNEKI